VASKNIRASDVEASALYLGAALAEGVADGSGVDALETAGSGAWLVQDVRATAQRAATASREATPAVVRRGGRRNTG
jgi:hypothetical protein